MAIVLGVKGAIKELDADKLEEEVELKPRKEIKFLQIKKITFRPIE